MGITALMSGLNVDRMELLSGSRDGTIKVWNLTTQQIEFSLELEHGKQAAEVCTLHVAQWRDAKWEEPRVFVFTGHVDGFVRVWDFTSKFLIFELMLEPDSAQSGDFVDSVLRRLEALRTSLTVAGSGAPLNCLIP
jgi:WD40 repeat protein